MEKTDNILLDSSSLCLNCRYRHGCTYREQAKLPVLHCELHEFEVAPPNGVVKKGPQQLIRTVSGICGTCDHRSYCALRDPERTITHCEHYE
ncbi:MAG: hypothetical protein KDB95_08340 [Flavobacteriales bacterium]|nr:hypothetical protein [Flavobacteriales bacterium]HPF90586.1 hypothetical protein [Flavobacteriales bacterium]